MRRWEALTGADVRRLRTELKMSRDALMERCQFPNAKSAARLQNIENKESWKPGDRERVVGAFRQLFWERGLEQPVEIGDEEYTAPDVTPASSVTVESVEHRPDGVYVTGTMPSVPAGPMSVGRPCAHSNGFSRTDDGRWVCADCNEETPRARQAREALEAIQGGTMASVAPTSAVDRNGQETVPGGASGVYQVTTLQPPVAETVEAVEAAVETAVIEQLAAHGATPVADTPEARTERLIGDQVEVAGVSFTKYSEDPFPARPDVTADPPEVVDVGWEQLEALWDDLLGTVVDTSDVRKADYVVTNSELRTWKRCHRKWWFAYYRSLGTRDVDYTSARATGDRVHRALQWAYGGTDRIDPRDALERVIVEDWTSITQVTTDETELAVVAERFAKANALERAMVEGYVEWLGESGADADYSIVGSEQVLSALFDLEVDGTTYLVELIGKLDARVLRKTDGALMFIDHKTVQNFVDVVPTLKQNEQMLTYVLLEALNAAEDEYVSGALYNMLRKVKRTAQAKPPFFERLEVRHNVHEVDSFRRHLHGATRDILRTRRQLDDGASDHDVAYPHPTNDCRWDCQFFRVCSMRDDGSPGFEDMLAQVYEQVDPNARYEGLTPTRQAVDRRESTQ